MQSSLLLGGAANDRLETTCRTGAANDPSPVEPEQQMTAWRLPVKLEQRMTHLLSNRRNAVFAAFAWWSSPLVEQRMTHLLSNQSSNGPLGDNRSYNAYLLGANFHGANWSSSQRTRSWLDPFVVWYCHATGMPSTGTNSRIVFL